MPNVQGNVQMRFTITVSGNSLLFKNLERTSGTLETGWGEKKRKKDLMWPSSVCAQNWKSASPAYILGWATCGNSEDIKGTRLSSGT